MFRLAVSAPLHRGKGDGPAQLGPPPASSRALLGAMREVRFGRGDYVFRQGERGDTFYVVVAGRGEAIRVHPDTGERSVLAQLTTGSCFGERALLRDDVRYAGILATAEEGLHAVQITREEFEAILGPLESRVADLYEESEQ